MWEARESEENLGLDGECIANIPLHTCCSSHATGPLPILPNEAVEGAECVFSNALLERVWMVERVQ